MNCCYMKSLSEIVPFRKIAKEICNSIPIFPLELDSQYTMYLDRSH